MGKYPTHQMYNGINLASRVYSLICLTVPDWQGRQLIQANSNFACAVANVNLTPEQIHHCWEEPEVLIGFTVSWGPEQTDYLDNAAGKLRASARTGLDTIQIVEKGGSLFQEGDFPHRGAAWTRGRLVAVSALTGEEDDWIARMIGGYLATEMSKIEATQLVTTGV